MSTAFFLNGPSMTIVASGTPTNIEVPPGSNGNPNVVYLTNNDPTYSIAVNVGFGSIANAAFPNDGAADGTGVIVVTQGSAMIRLNSTYETANLVVSAVSDGTARLFITPGVL